MTVSWSFLKSILIGMEFPNKFILWVMECVTSNLYSLIINGNFQGFFKGKKRLRQGDPLSLFLFVLCLEYFSRSLKIATGDPDFNSHPKCGRLKITHLTFADDLMLMARGDVPSVKIVMKCLADFGTKSGLYVNNLKSNMFATGLEDHELEEIMSVAN